MSIDGQAALNKMAKKKKKKKKKRKDGEMALEEDQFDL